VIYGLDSEALYIGSSTGTTADGQMRRTVLRHLQNWSRSDDSRPPGTTFDRREAVVALFPMPGNDNAAILLMEGILIDLAAAYAKETGAYTLLNTSRPVRLARRDDETPAPDLDASDEADLDDLSEEQIGDMAEDETPF
jgi:hypothetical protein